jgi:hypothetical protein
MVRCLSKCTFTCVMEKPKTVSDSIKIPLKIPNFSWNFQSRTSRNDKD